jgi:hypothetical protein
MATAKNVTVPGCRGIPPGGGDVDDCGLRIADWGMGKAWSIEHGVKKRCGI